MAGRPSFSLVLVASAVLAAGLSAQSERRDSAGVEIVTSHSPEWTASTRWTVEPQPVVHVGRAGDRLEFGRIVAAGKLPDGRLVVADQLSSTVHVLTAAGSEEKRIGREGDGPGEFRRIRSLQVLGDTIAVFDGVHGRVSKFDAEATLVGETLVRVGGMPGVAQATQVADGRLVLQAAVLAGPGPPGIEELVHPVVVLDPTSGEHAIVLQLVGHEIYRTDEGFIQRRPLEPRLSTAFADRLYAGNGRSWSIDVYDAGGTPIASWRRADVDLSTSRREFRELTESLVEGLESENQKRVWRRAYSGQPVPESIPAFDRLLSAGTEVWARNYQVPPEAEAESWAIFDNTGVFLGEILMPEGFELLHVDGEDLLGVHRDDYDVEALMGLRVRKGAQANKELL